MREQLSRTAWHSGMGYRLSATALRAYPSTYLCPQTDQAEQKTLVMVKLRKGCYLTLRHASLPKAAKPVINSSVPALPTPRPGQRAMSCSANPEEPRCLHLCHNRLDSCFCFSCPAYKLQSNGHFCFPPNQAGGPSAGAGGPESRAGGTAAQRQHTEACSNHLCTDHQVPSPVPNPWGPSPLTLTLLQLHHLGGARTGPHIQSVRFPKAGLLSRPQTAPDTSCRHVGSCLFILCTPCFRTRPPLPPPALNS